MYGRCLVNLYDAFERAVANAADGGRATMPVSAKAALYFSNGRKVTIFSLSFAQRSGLSY